MMELDINLILIVASTKDRASINIKQQLLHIFGFKASNEKLLDSTIHFLKVGREDVKLFTINEEPVYHEHVDKMFNPQLVIYISRHRSKSGSPTLSVHAPGNLTSTIYGGIPQKTSIAPAYAMKAAMLEMKRQKEKLHLSYDISYECTHHGPSLDVPAMFVELGSSPTQWSDKEAAMAVAYAVMASFSKPIEKSTVALGIGGPHYNKKFTRMALQGSFAFGHIIPKYAVAQLKPEIINQCVERNVEKVEAVVLDWKGIKSADKPGLIEILNEVKVKTLKV